MADAVLEREAAASFKVNRLGSAVGAEITGLDLAAPSSDATVSAVRAALIDHGMLCIRGQGHVTPDQQMAFAARFGEISVHPYVPSIAGYPGLMKIHDPNPITQTWHADSTHRKDPPAITFLLARILPAIGGDTMFASTSNAYERLSPGLKTTLQGLKAIHQGTEMAREAGLSREDVTVAHPVVLTHPESGRPGLFVNGNYVTHFEGWSAMDSAPLLQHLYGEIARVENIYRHRWRDGDLVIWDNLSTQHAVVGDTAGAERVLHRVTIAGRRLS